MFKITLKTDRRVFVSSKRGLVIIPVNTFERGRGRKARGARWRSCKVKNERLEALNGQQTLTLEQRRENEHHLQTNRKGEGIR